LVFPVPHPVAVQKNNEMARGVIAYLTAAKEIIAADRNGQLKWIV